jgi:putative SOS response-associated peptidase YedK
MCGRFALYSPRSEIIQTFALATNAPAIEARYNIAPSQPIAAIRSKASADSRRLDLLYWGLVPSWARERSIGTRLSNARSETLREKPSFREAYRRRRCLVPANGYYEWQTTSAGKQPYFIHLEDRRPFAMAALWEAWRDPGDGQILESCALITTRPSPALAAIHDRMPVILPPDRHAEWLDPGNTRVELLDALLVPYQSPAIRFHRVSRKVNDARNQGAGLIEPDADGMGSLFPLDAGDGGYPAAE